MSPLHLCVHGHFYQPPRENPWLETVEAQASAAPYHDWNQRVGAECYAPNAAARLLDAQGRVARTVNNYARMSFDFGPTLLSWLERHDPDTYGAIRAADRSGPGGALAQAYNHSILPLCTPRDRRTQVRWGIRDFQHRYGRAPEGMWLPETAADVDTLEALAGNGIRFTVLAPHQARPEDGAPLDPAQPYECALPSGRRIALFCYDGALAHAVAFGGLLHDGDALVARLTAPAPGDGPQLRHYATDGESYGHHHKFGDMALAYAFSRIEAGTAVRLTNYGAYLQQFPPRRRARLVSDTSWSCAHGVERWRGPCGCGARDGRPLDWRAPLRQAVDGLRDGLDLQFERQASALLRDPWEARDDFIGVILVRQRASVEEFLLRHARRALSGAERVAVLRLLEMQRHGQLMQTSCGWFHEDLARIEAIQILRYAACGLELAGDPALESRFLEALRPARSGDPEEGGALQIWERHVRPARHGVAAGAWIENFRFPARAGIRPA